MAHPGNRNRFICDALSSSQVAFLSASGAGPLFRLAPRLVFLGFVFSRIRLLFSRLLLFFWVSASAFSSRLVLVLVPSALLSSRLVLSALLSSWPVLVLVLVLSSRLFLLFQRCSFLRGLFLFLFLFFLRGLFVVLFSFPASPGLRGSLVIHTIRCPTS